MKLFIISDTHYYHSKIIEYENRPFSNVEEMNEYMIQEHNNVVSNEDIVVHFGDFSFGGKQLVTEIFNQLNGNLYLIMGNHDRRRSRNWYINLGFVDVFRKPVHLQNFILSHEPINHEKIIEYNKINCHGHIHNNVHYNNFIKDLSLEHYYVNFCVEKIEYRPFEVIDEQLKDQILDWLELVV